MARTVSSGFPTAVVAWVDLLGYGAAIARAGFDPAHPEARLAIGRLRRFHRLVAEHSKRAFPTLVMNDGAVAYRDLSPSDASVTADFLRDAWRLFAAVNTAEARDAFPGARMVIAAGFRMKGRRAGLDADELRLRSAFDIVPPLQANFAFTKAYVAEQTGSAGGLGGARCFVEMTLLGRSRDGLELGETIAWRHPKLGLAAEFAPLKAAPFVGLGETPPGVRDGGAVARALAAKV